jgi:cell fate regulator YaaT (PSP1 superfamily)
VEEARESGAPPAWLVGVRFKPAGRIHDYDAGRLPLAPGDLVIVPTEHGQALGTVASPPREAPVRAGSRTPQRVIKRADARDLQREDANQVRARDAQRLALEQIRSRRLEMKLIKADYLFDGTKVVIYFHAKDRVDFRQLVRDLAHMLHTRVEMKQIGERDETKMTGGIGPCGRELCCSSWLREFQPVSLKMAKAQGLSLNPSKLAGMCGRLKCCLRYEYDTYLELGRNLPAVGSNVVSVKGDGKVVRQHLLRQTVVVRRQEDGVEVEATLEDLVEKKPE